MTEPGPFLCPGLVGRAVGPCLSPVVFLGAIWLSEDSDALLGGAVCLGEAILGEAGRRFFSQSSYPGFCSEPGTAHSSSQLLLPFPLGIVPGPSPLVGIRTLGPTLGLATHGLGHCGPAPPTAWASGPSSFHVRVGPIRSSKLEACSPPGGLPSVFKIGNFLTEIRISSFS